MSGYEYRLRKVNNSIGMTCDVTFWSTPSSITGELAFMNGMIAVFEFQIDREGNLSVREWEWESGIGNVGVTLPMMQGEPPINTINTVRMSLRRRSCNTLTKEWTKIPQQKSRGK